MSLPEEEAFALRSANDFLLRLGSGEYQVESITKLRQEARRIMRHFPLDVAGRWALMVEAERYRAMTDDNAEKAWDEWINNPARSAGHYSLAKAAFIAGRASLKADVESLRQQLAERDAVIERAVKHWESPYGDDDYATRQMVTELREQASTALDAVKADAWDEGLRAPRIYNGSDPRIVNPYRKEADHE